MTPIQELTDADLMERIRILRSPAYRNLSRYHTARLAALEAEAGTRGLKL